jgi:hypothetical protein
MADSTISGLSAAAVADRAFEVPVNKGGGENAKVTLEQIVDLVSDTISNVHSVAQVRSVTSAELVSVTSGVVSVTSLEYLSLVNRVSVNSGTGGTASVTSTEYTSLVERVSAIVGGSGSVTSAEVLSAIDQSVLNNGGTSVQGLQSVFDALSNRICIVSNAASDALSHANAASGAATSADGHANVASDAATSVNARVNSVNTFISGISARTSTGGATSVHGFQSVINELSDQISNEASARAASVATLSDAVTSVDTRVNAVSQLVCVLSNQVSILESVVSVQLSQLISAVSNVSCQSAGGSATGLQAVINMLSNKISQAGGTASVTSAEYASTVSIVTSIASAISNVSANSDLGSATGLQNVINLLSNKISQVVAGGGLTSAQTSAMITSVNGVTYSTRAFSALGTAGTSVKGLQSVINQISNTFSNAFSAGSVVSSRITSVYGQVALLQTTLAASVGAALADITGTTVAVSAGGYYEYRAHLNVAMSVANTYGIGITFPGMKDGAATGYMYGTASVGASAGESVTGGRFFAFDEDGSGSIILSVTKGVASVTPAIVQAAFAVSTGGNIILQYRSSVSTANVKINPGSYARLFKLN